MLSGERRPTLEATREGGAAVLAVGRFANAVIKFLIVAFAVFWLVRVLARFKQEEEARPTAPPAPTPTEKLLAEIRDELRAARGVPATGEARTA